MQRLSLFALLAQISVIAQPGDLVSNGNFGQGLVGWSSNGVVELGQPGGSLTPQSKQPGRSYAELQDSSAEIWQTVDLTFDYQRSAYQLTFFALPCSQTEVRVTAYLGKDSGYGDIQMGGNWGFRSILIDNKSSFEEQRRKLRITTSGCVRLTDIGLIPVEVFRAATTGNADTKALSSRERPDPWISTDCRRFLIMQGRRGLAITGPFETSDSKGVKEYHSVTLRGQLGARKFRISGGTSGRLVLSGEIDPTVLSGSLSAGGKTSTLVLLREGHEASLCPEELSSDEPRGLTVLPAGSSGPVGSNAAERFEFVDSKNRPVAITSPREISVQSDDGTNSTLMVPAGQTGVTLLERLTPNIQKLIGRTPGLGEATAIIAGCPSLNPTKVAIVPNAVRGFVGESIVIQTYATDDSGHRARNALGDVVIDFKLASGSVGYIRPDSTRIPKDQCLLMASISSDEEGKSMINPTLLGKSTYDAKPTIFICTNPKRPNWTLVAFAAGAAALVRYLLCIYRRIKHRTQEAILASALGSLIYLGFSLALSATGGGAIFINPPAAIFIGGASATFSIPGMIRIVQNLFKRFLQKKGKSRRQGRSEAAVPVGPQAKFHQENPLQTVCQTTGILQLSVKYASVDGGF